ncbi:MAG: hypothetical protein ABIO46_00320 [Chitinophagales bacterium]
MFIFLSACEKSSVDIEPIEIDKSYFPLSSGKYIIYDVDSIVLSDFFDTTDTVHYQVMEQVDSPFLDASNQEAFRIVRSRRNSVGDAWMVTDIWSANLTETTAEKVEENLRFVKLNFPVLLNKTWKGNSHISTDSPLVYLSDWDYKYTEVNVQLQIDTAQFDSVVTVTQHDDENAIQKILYLEKYARNIGLIYKEEQNVETQPGQYPDGYILIMKISEHN